MTDSLPPPDDTSGSAPAPSPDVLDLDCLAQMVAALDAETAVVLVDGFVEEMIARADRIGAAATSGDSEALAREAHALKSSAGTYGAREVNGLASAIERGAKAGDGARAAVEARGMPEAARRAAAAFADWKRRTVPSE